MGTCVAILLLKINGEVFSSRILTLSKSPFHLSILLLFLKLFTVNFCYSRHAQGVVSVILINEQQCFIKFKTRGAAECFRLDKTRTANLLNGFKIF